ncbi:uncharacterized protein LOC126643283, partial [Myiozetetes cayanensis]|uniref:uncharacterized protein LOC126643283 n=1 Tax=Myiozetetes cayanensis TaxID=478635 RepID=UPI00215E0144
GNFEEFSGLFFQEPFFGVFWGALHNFWVNPTPFFGYFWQPRPRYFHGGAILGDTLVVLGGRTDGSDFSNDLLLYQTRCNSWLGPPHTDNSTVGPPMPGAVTPALAEAGGLLFVSGGFSGRALGGFWSLRVPPEPCLALGTPQLCLGAGAACAWCGGQCRGAEEAQRLPWRAPLACKWCTNCPSGLCIGAGGSCRRENDCRINQREIRAPQNCSEAACAAPDCPRCARAGRCMWTRQFKRTGETRRILSVQPSYAWTCFSHSLLNVSPMPVESAPPLPCPSPCHLQPTCLACLSSPGADGGWQHCQWSTALQQCLSPSFVPLRCLPGGCGRLLRGSERCPPDCGGASQCSQCLRRPRCGWCSHPGQDGGGSCLQGGIKGPSEGGSESCEGGLWSYLGGSQVVPGAFWGSQVDFGGVSGGFLGSPGGFLGSQVWFLGGILGPRCVQVCSGGPRCFLGVSGAFLGSPGGPESCEGGLWSYLSCPPEDECANGHHTCGPSQVCRDLPRGFTCTCREGYAPDSSTGECRPVCGGGCSNGTCVAPGRCRCPFASWAPPAPCPAPATATATAPAPPAHAPASGATTTPRARSASGAAPCSWARPWGGTHLGGPQCERCRPVRGLGPGGTCRACSSFCGGHAQTCPLPHLQIHTWVTEGPSEADAVCVNCGNNSLGDRCDTCRPGFFLLDGTCTRCQCNGHADTCNELDGTGCPCQNNTESAPCPERRHCHRHQCSKCRDSFQGHPVGGQQCYRLLAVEQEYCLDPQSQSQCFPPPQRRPLPPGRAVPFAVQPKFTNVDIRVTLDVTFGAVDLYVATAYDTFAVDVEPRTGRHLVRVRGLGQLGALGALGALVLGLEEVEELEELVLGLGAMGALVLGVGGLVGLEELVLGLEEVVVATGGTVTILAKLAILVILVTLKTPTPLPVTILAILAILVFLELLKTPTPLSASILVILVILAILVTLKTPTPISMAILAILVILVTLKTPTPLPVTVLVILVILVTLKTPTPISMAILAILVILAILATLATPKTPTPLGTPPQTPPAPAPVLREERAGAGLVTYLTVADPVPALVVRGVRDRLVLTYPHNRHPLKSTRFYLLVLGGPEPSQGLLFFRQDQAHIDLFVFFSVFFSCFFLFLALCVLLWKAKQGLDARHERRRHRQEMSKMAARPFARVTVCFETRPGYRRAPRGYRGWASQRLANCKVEGEEVVETQSLHLETQNLHLETQNVLVEGPKNSLGHQETPLGHQETPLGHQKGRLGNQGWPSQRLANRKAEVEELMDPQSQRLETQNLHLETQNLHLETQNVLVEGPKNPLGHQKGQLGNQGWPSQRLANRKLETEEQLETQNLHLETQNVHLETQNVLVEGPKNPLGHQKGPLGNQGWPSQRLANRKVEGEETQNVHLETQNVHLETQNVLVEPKMCSKNSLGHQKGQLGNQGWPSQRLANCKVEGEESQNVHLETQNVHLETQNVHLETQNVLVEGPKNPLGHQKGPLGNQGWPSQRLANRKAEGEESQNVHLETQNLHLETQNVLMEGPNPHLEGPKISLGHQKGRLGNQGWPSQRLANRKAEGEEVVETPNVLVEGPKNPLGHQETPLGHQDPQIHPLDPQKSPLDPQNIHLDPQNVHLDPQIHSRDSQDPLLDPQKSPLDPQTHPRDPKIPSWPPKPTPGTPKNTPWTPKPTPGTPRTPSWSPKNNPWTPKIPSWPPKPTPGTPKSHPWTPKISIWPPKTPSWPPKNTPGPYQTHPRDPKNHPKDPQKHLPGPPKPLLSGF